MDHEGFINASHLVFNCITSIKQMSEQLSRYEGAAEPDRRSYGVPQYADSELSLPLLRMVSAGTEGGAPRSLSTTQHSMRIHMPKV